MKFTLNIDCDTPAFSQDHRLEVGRILVNTMTAVMMKEHLRAATLHDSNGEKVGIFEFLPADL